MQACKQEIADKAAWYNKWIIGQSKAEERQWGHIRGPEQEWLRKHPIGVAIAINRWDYCDNDWRQEIARVCLAMPEGTPEALIRAEAFSGVLRRSAKVVLPEFDLCGHLYLDGQICRKPCALGCVDEATINRIKEAHPLRSFDTRWDHAAGETIGFLRCGIGGKLRQVDEQLRAIMCDEERHFLAGMRMVLQAFSDFVAAHADAAEKFGKTDVATSLRHIATEPPRTFFEALQLIWLRFVVFGCERRHAMAFGRLDQHLYPFYKTDVEAGRLTREEALDLICQLITFSVNAEDIIAVTIGGLTPDGTDGTNELTFLILEAAHHVRVPLFSLFARAHQKSPGAYLEACARLILSGGGMPAMVNDEISLKQLARIGVAAEDAVKHCFTGCAHLYVEGLQVPWREAWVVIPRIIMTVLNGLRRLPEIEVSYARIMEEFREELSRQIRGICDSYNSAIERVSHRTAPDLFFSAFVDDCITRHREHNNGGSRYPGFIGGDLYGTAHAADMLMALKKLVFEERRFGFAEVMSAVETNFENHENLRRQLLGCAPKFGNDNDAVDAIAAEIVGMISEEFRVQSPLLRDGSILSPNFPGTAAYVALGADLAATPDGRLAGEPLSDSGSPVAGRDMKGLTALLNSYGKIDHVPFCGMALNVRLNKDDFQGAEGIKRFLSILAVMLTKGIQELQFNSVSDEDLRAAQRKPEMHENLLVRVAGYSGRFTQLNTAVQDAIIARQQHG